MGITRNNRHKRRATGGKKKHYRKNRKFEMGRQPTNTKMGERKTSLVRMRGGSMKVRAIRLDAGNFSWASEGMGRKARILGVTYNATSNELVRTNTLVKNAIIQVDAAPFRLWYEQHYGIKLVKKKLGAKKGAKPAAPTGKKVAKPAAGAKKGAKTAAKGAAKTAGTKKPVAKTTEKKVEEATDKKPLSKAAQTVAAALVKRYKLSIRKRAKLVAKWRRLNREMVREKRQLTKFEKKVKTLKAGRKSFAEKLANRSKRAQHFIAKRQGVRRARMVNKKIDSHLLDQFQTGRLYACIASRPGQDGCADGYILEGKELEFYIKKMKK